MKLAQALFMVAIAGFASAALNINACGIYTWNAAAGNTASFTGDIVANSSSVITNGACVYIVGSWTSADFAAGGNITFGGHSITNNGSSAQYAILLNDTHANGGGTETVRVKETIDIYNFGTGFLMNQPLEDQADAYGLQYFSNGMLRTHNTTVSMALMINGTPLSMNFNITPCGAGQALVVNALDPSSGYTVKIRTNSTCALAGNFQSSDVGSNALMMYSTVQFGLSGYFWNSTANLTSTPISGSFPASMSGSNQSGGANSSYNWYLSNPFFLSNVTDGTNQWFSSFSSNISGTSKFYYCVDTRCNPLFFQDGFTVPFFISIPSSPCVTQIIPLNYSRLQLWDVQGFSQYLVFSSKDNEDQFALLKLSGIYKVVLDNGTGTSVGYAAVQSGTGGCYIQVSNLSSVIGGNFYSDTGNCHQVNASVTSCSFSSNNPLPRNWTMVAMYLSSYTQACMNSSNATSGEMTCWINDSASVALYSDSALVATSLHSRVLSGNFMWYIIYGGCMIVLIFVTTKVPIIMCILEMALALMFYLVGAIPAETVVASAAMWSLALVGVVISMLKKGSG